MRKITVKVSSFGDVVVSFFKLFFFLLEKFDVCGRKLVVVVMVAVI